MAKNRTKKKRTKAYSGADAASTGPVVRRYSAPDRNRLQQWWHERKAVAKPIGIAVAVIAFLVWMIGEIVRIVF